MSIVAGGYGAAPVAVTVDAIQLDLIESRLQLTLEESRRVVDLPDLEVALDTTLDSLGLVLEEQALELTLEQPVYNLDVDP